MKIKKITKVGKKPVFDLSVEGVEHYVLENGVVTHNTGVMYSADTVFIIGRRQVKEGTEIVGYEFVINIEKSRYVKEKSKLPITVTFDGGINPFSGLIDIAVELGFVVKPKNGWYAKSFLDAATGEMHTEDKNYRLKDTNTSAWWAPLIKHAPFREAIKARYQLGSMVNDEAVEAELIGLLSADTEDFSAGGDVDNIEAQLDSFSLDTLDGDENV